MNPVILITIVYLLINYTNNQYVNKKGQQFYQNNDPDIYDISYEYLPNYEKLNRVFILIISLLCQKRPAKSTILTLQA